MNPLRRTVTLITAPAVALAALVAVTSAPSSTAAPAVAPAVVGDDVAAWAEVEDGVISGGAAGPPVLNSGDHGNFSGTGSYTFRETGMTSTMTVEVPTAGVYPVHVRYTAGPLGPDENVTRSIGLLTNGTDRQQLSLPMTSFEDWESWQFVSSEVTLAAGANTLAIQCDRSVDFCRLNFDAIQVGGTDPDPCAANAPEAGYESLFDGTFESFDGWRKAGSGGFGRQTDCVVRGVRGRGATWFTEQQAAPYTLEVDWRRQQSNDDSSVYVGSTSRAGADPVDGYAVRIGSADTAAVVPSGGAAVPADAAAVAGALRPVGEWNTFTIRLTTTQVTVHLNGTLVNTVTSAGPSASAGFVGLENRSVTDQVDFRNIRIKPGVDPDQVDSTTSVRVAPATVTVRRDAATATITVSAVGAPPTGRVELLVGGSRVATAELRNGRGTARLAPFATVGTRTITARYLGGPTARPSTSAATRLTVRKAAPRVTAAVRPAKVVAKRTRAKVVIAVAAQDFTPTGKVTVRVGRQTYAGTLRGGRVTVRLARFAKAGTVRARVAYAGDALATSATTSATVRVTKPRRR